jgi:hypothetical protein
MSSVWGLFGGFGLLGVAMGVFFVVLLAVVLTVFVLAAVRGGAQWKRDNDAPLLTGPATVVTKREHVWGGSGDTGASTTYYATFQLPAGDRVELPVPATQYGQLVEGDQGVLTHQGTRFKGFARTS